MSGLGRTRAAPVTQVPDEYSERSAAALGIYNADLVPPATSYATTRSGLSSGYVEPTIAPKTGGAFKSGKWRLNGMIQNWAWGGTDQSNRIVSLPQGANGGLNGFVNVSTFQTVLVQLHDWATNTAWYNQIGGSPMTGSGVFKGGNPVRENYPSFRVNQLQTAVTGGPGAPSMRMNRTPRFTSVQNIVKYTASPSRYNTTSTSK